MRLGRVALAAALVLVAATDTGIALHRTSGGPPLPTADHAAVTRDATAGGQPAAAVAGALARRADAITHHDLAAFTTLLDPAVPAFVDRQRAQFQALTTLPLTDVSVRADPGSAAHRRPPGYGDLPTYVPTVTVSYEIAGYDTAPVTATEVDTYVERGGRWLLASDSDVTPPTPEIWRDGPLVVVERARSLVVAHPAEAATARAVAAEVDRDVAAVTAVWGSGWPQRAVVLLPSDQTELAALLGQPGDLSQVAAMESAEVGGATQAGARIEINPTPYASLSPLGRRVVMTHELTHVASRLSTTASTPLWLVEGLADVVGFGVTALPPTTIAAELATQLRRGDVPTALPADTAFRPAAPGLAATYEQAWLACRLIAERIGTSGLVAFYRQVGAAGTNPAAAVDGALRDRLGESTAQFTRDWVGYLHEQLGA